MTSMPPAAGIAKEARNSIAQEKTEKEIHGSSLSSYAQRLGGFGHGILGADLVPCLDHLSLFIDQE
jgi:hypothetical protein